MVPVEKLCQYTGEVLKIFDSKAEAERSDGVTLGSRMSVCLRGYFYRRMGSTAKPPKVDEARVNSRARGVDKLFLKTHKVVATFYTVTDAATSVSTSSLTYALKRRSKTCRGYFWRYTGTKVLPAECPRHRQIANKLKSPVHTRGVELFEQVCLETRQVLAVYNSYVDAAVAVGAPSSSIASTVNGRTT